MREVASRIVDRPAEDRESRARLDPRTRLKMSILGIFSYREARERACRMEIVIVGGTRMEDVERVRWRSCHARGVSDR